jgi:hypothetical protein
MASETLIIDPSGGDGYHYLSLNAAHADFDSYTDDVLTLKCRSGECTTALLTINHTGPTLVLIQPDDGHGHGGQPDASGVAEIAHNLSIRRSNVVVSDMLVNTMLDLQPVANGSDQEFSNITVTNCITNDPITSQAVKAGAYAITAHTASMQAVISNHLVYRVADYHASNGLPGGDAFNGLARNQQSGSIAVADIVFINCGMIVKDTTPESDPDQIPDGWLVLVSQVTTAGGGSVTADFSIVNCFYLKDSDDPTGDSLPAGFQISDGSGLNLGTISNNINTETSGVSGVTDDVDFDQWVDFDAKDLRPATDGDLYDAGTTHPNLTSIDIKGDDRDENGTPDIGPYEYSETAPPAWLSGSGLARSLAIWFDDDDEELETRART